ncbi:MAG TPA: phage integrase N-terminal SAM-like domain-containing protein [Desulfopila sp.]|nr:phage integrase N-terminal SAM-like domain-containing protein [Desulfopila sp.]
MAKSPGACRRYSCGKASPGKRKKLHGEAGLAEALLVKEQQPQDVRHNGRRASWKRECNRLKEEIRLRHYSDKTLQTYRTWMPKFQTYTGSKEPDLLSADDVKTFQEEGGSFHGCLQPGRLQASPRGGFMARRNQG